MVNSKSLILLQSFVFCFFLISSLVDISFMDVMFDLQRNSSQESLSNTFFSASYHRDF